MAIVTEKVKVIDFRKLNFLDFPFSCTYITNQKDFEKESHTVSMDGTVFINKRIKGYECFKQIAEITAKMTRYELEQLLKMKKNSKSAEDVFLCKYIEFEKSRRYAEKKYYSIK